jgi:hypothetical protein
MLPSGVEIDLDSGIGFDPGSFSTGALLTIGFLPTSNGTTLRLQADVRDVKLPTYVKLTDEYGNEIMDSFRAAMRLASIETVEVHHSIFQNISGPDPTPASSTTALLWDESNAQLTAPSITIRDTLFDRFDAGEAAGALTLASYVWGYTSVIIINTNFTNLTAQGEGAAVNMVQGCLTASGRPQSPPVSFIGCLFDSNAAMYNGGALRLGTMCSYLIQDCTFTNNLAGLSGGALSLQIPQVGNATLVISGTTFAGNQAGTSCSAATPCDVKTCGGAMQVSRVAHRLKH